MSEAVIPAAEAPLVEARALGVVIGGRPVLESVDLEVRPGEIVTLIGPNGTGKTTLVRALIGQVPPSSGEVHTRADLRIGYVPQKFQVDDTLPLSVRAFLDLPRRRDRAEVDRVLAEVGAEALAGQLLYNLSGGEMQRTLLARALLRDPELLVLDEPLQGVDLTGQATLFRLVGEVRHRRGCGVLLVSHDLHLVMAGTDRVVCLNRHVCCSGTPETVSRHPAYLTLFGEAVPDGLAVYAHKHDHAHDLAGEVVGDGSADGRDEASR